jgi:hypothetical protein
MRKKEKITKREGEHGKEKKRRRRRRRRRRSTTLNNPISRTIHKNDFTKAQKESSH